MMHGRCDTVLWRDAHDHDTIVIGRAYAKCDEEPLYVAWLTCHIDATPNDLTNVDQKYRNFAEQTLYRWYQIGFAFPDEIDAVFHSIDDIEMLSHQVRTHLVDGAMQRRPPIIYGVWDPGNGAFDDFDNTLSIDRSDDPPDQYKRGFQLDTKTGVVKFDQPVYLRGDKNTNDGRFPTNSKDGDGVRRTFPARLRIRIGFHIKQDVKSVDNPPWQRKEVVVGKKGGGSRQYVRRNDIGYEWYKNQDGPVDNLKEYEQEAKQYIELERRKLIGSRPASVTYAGVKKIELDGAIQQVTWTISSAGFATTRASRNREEPLVATPHNEKRFFEQMNDMATIQAWARGIPGGDAILAVEGE